MSEEIKELLGRRVLLIFVLYLHFIHGLVEMYNGNSSHKMHSDRRTTQRFYCETV
jgi:hypothetical protein